MKTIMTPTANRPAWKSLELHAQKMRDVHLRTLFTDDPTRGERLTAEGAGLFLDYSKNRVSDETIGLLIQVAQESDALRLARDSQIWALFVIIPIAIPFVFALATLLSRFVLDPVGRLTKTAEHIAKDPKSKEQIAVQGNDEMARLASAFNTMTTRLQSANSDLEDSLDRQKRFASDAAHELRTPLASISLAAENGLHVAATPAEMQRSLTLIERGANTMGKLTEVLLNLARLDRTDQRLPTTAVNARDIVVEAVSGANLANDPRVRIRISNDAPKINANANALRQVLTNLLENASFYDPTGMIEVTQNGCRLEIRDEGEGIAEEHLPHLFERFYRADPARTRAHGGHGLGLAIAKRLAEAQGATLSVKSVLGEGTSFFLDFSDSSQIPNLDQVE